MTRSIPWLRVFIEGVVIVGSILLAFGIDAWWEGRNERRAVQTALEDVVLEVQVGRTELVDAIDTNRSRISLFEEFLSLTPEEIQALTEDSLEVVAWSFLPPRTFDGGGRALAGLLAGGNLTLIPDPDVRAAVVEWGRFPDEIDEDYTITTTVAQAMQDLAARRGLALAGATRVRGEAYPGAESLSRVMGRLRGNEEFVGVLAQLADEYTYFVAELEVGIPMADELLSVASRRRR